MDGLIKSLWYCGSPKLTVYFNQH